MVRGSEIRTEPGSQESNRGTTAARDHGLKLIVGLGNPGIEYQFTPHNLGFLTVDRMANDRGVEIRNRQCRALTAKTVVGAQPVVLAKPQTFMNLSGLAVRELVESFEIRPESDLIVIYDELDLAMGRIRIRERGRSAGHKGMESIMGALGSEEFLRVRLGIAPEKRILRPFPKSRLKQVDELLGTAAEAVEVILTEGRAAAMNRFNRKPEPPAAAE